MPTLAELLQQVQHLDAQAQQAALTTADQLEQFRLLYLAKQGQVQGIMKALAGLGAEEKKQLGAAVNQLKQQLEARYQLAKEALDAQAGAADAPQDLSLPGRTAFTGGVHPLTHTMRRIISIFDRIGFDVVEGPEVEDDWHNFTALNFAENHPARDMQDTFFVEGGRLLRTHTTSVQVRILETQPPPVRLLMPGRVYRNEAISARAHCFFHQVDGVAIDEGLSFADMKQTLLYFVRNLFGADVQIRLRPSYFPFTEISAEMDINCRICNGAGCNVCKHTGWVEILGCGMVDPHVLENCGVDPERYSGYAWGMGVERVAQLLYRVPDLRLYSQNDLRFLSQFSRL